MQDGRLGFESFTLAHQLSLGVLAEGFVGTLLYHDQRAAAARLDLFVHNISEQPSFRAVVFAAQDAMSALCGAATAVFFVTNSRGECTAESPLASLPATHSPELGKGTMKCDIKTMIGSGLVGRCAIGRRVLCFGEADIRQLRRMRTWREKEGASEEDDEKKEEGQVQYDEWERGIVDLSTSILVVPFVLSRDDSLLGVMLMSRLPLPLQHTCNTLQHTCNTLQHTHLPPPTQSPLQPAPSVVLENGG
eukprot:CAMPEP_0173090586 /NCGR_PEP_ID=MMETSP1102-20130122/27046_1 /TAXON_ID=49646 /ORGANISM="Geminigera sp., Strain Caron Lab Isolate" /LENGTH=247 /DNA_ID=CAMNT_0013975565 /DNA_START=147 /DNA_END=886 /DNA_ORIENTATION=+